MTPVLAPRALVADWVRLGLVALAMPQLATGTWALVDASHWFDHFPGFAPRLVAAEPPFNAHLAADAGAGFLATAVVLLLAARWGDRRSVVLSLAGYAAFAVPHLVYHAANPAPGLSGAEDAVNVLVLAVGAAAPAVLLWGTSRSSSGLGRPAPVETTPHPGAAGR
jgi:hypothetical protein